jgi:hypothetical protein
MHSSCCIPRLAAICDIGRTAAFFAISRSRFIFVTPEYIIMKKDMIIMHDKIAFVNTREDLV